MPVNASAFKVGKRGHWRLLGHWRHKPESPLSPLSHKRLCWIEMLYRINGCPSDRWSHPGGQKVRKKQRIKKLHNIHKPPLKCHETVENLILRFYTFTAWPMCMIRNAYFFSNFSELLGKMLLTFLALLLLK